MSELVTVGIGASGYLPIISEIPNFARFTQGDTVLKFLWGGNHLWLHPGSEIVLINLLTKGSLEEDAQELTMRESGEYLSPITVFENNKISQQRSLQVGTSYTGKKLAVVPVGDGLLAAPQSQIAEAFGELQIPGQSHFRWAQKPLVNPHALKASYETWRRTFGRNVGYDESVVKFVKKNTPPPGFKRKLLIAVTRDIFNAAGNQLQ